MSNHHDLIIAGAGAAGLSLISAVLARPELSHLRILLVDRTLEASGDKTWCFWAGKGVNAGKHADHIWNSVSVRTADGARTEPLSDLSYLCVRSDSFSERVLREASANDRVTLLEAEIREIASERGRAVVRTDRGEFTASWCFQSALRPPPVKVHGEEIRLIQHFVGWEVELEEDLFDPDTVTLMDFDVAQEDGVTFFYVLPFSSRKALVEFTMFSTRLLEDAHYDIRIREYLRERFGLADGRWVMRRREKGSIPMETDRMTAWLNPRTLNIGMVGGHTKPSTGYTFLRIQRQAEQIADDLAAGRKPSHAGSSPFRFRVYDLMLLSILKSDPETGLRIFHRLFRMNAISSILRFLDERSTFLQELWIFSRLPYPPFLNAIWRHRHRILKGA